MRNRVYLAIMLSPLVVSNVACRNGGSSSPPSTATPPDSPRTTPAPAPETIAVDALGERLWPGPDVGDYAPMAASEKRELAAAAWHLWRCAAPASAATALAPTAAELAPARYVVTGTGQPVALDGLVGVAPGARGRGVYLARCDSAMPRILLQAPHPYFDQLTEQIALRWLVEASAPEAPRALFAGSVHRYWSADGTRPVREDSPADVSHNEAHEMTVATAAIAALQPGLIVVQVHGFGTEPSELDMVISSGSSTPSAKVVALAAALRVYGYRVGVYPLDTPLLGATSNAQRRAVAPHGAAFVHLELARGVRQALAIDAGARALVWQAIVAAVSTN
ncbi:MAG: hypothetical protein IPL79_15485 [Myxococcales bacterium]|nr:hypothetical protein [Myxococcales bacterium]